MLGLDCVDRMEGLVVFLGVSWWRFEVDLEHLKNEVNDEDLKHSVRGFVVVEGCHIWLVFAVWARSFKSKWKQITFLETGTFHFNYRKTWTTNEVVIFPYRGFGATRSWSALRTRVSRVRRFLGTTSRVDNLGDTIWWGKDESLHITVWLYVFSWICFFISV